MVSALVTVIKDKIHMKFEVKVRGKFPRRSKTTSLIIYYFANYLSNILFQSHVC